MDKHKYIFDINEYERRISSITYFSTAFKRSLIEKLQKCNRAMEPITWDSEPEPEFNIPECSYLWYDNWIGGQGEVLNEFKIIDRFVIDQSYKFTIGIYANAKRFTKSEVIVIKEDGQYRIDSIELNWKK